MALGGPLRRPFPRCLRREEITVKGREVYIHYPDGMGRSKLKTSFTDEGTARNLNTLRKLIAMAENSG